MTNDAFPAACLLPSASATGPASVSGRSKPSAGRRVTLAGPVADAPGSDIFAAALERPVAALPEPGRKGHAERELLLCGLGVQGVYIGFKVALQISGKQRTVLRA